MDKGKIIRLTPAARAISVALAATEAQYVQTYKTAENPDADPDADPYAQIADAATKAEQAMDKNEVLGRKHSDMFIDLCALVLGENWVVGVWQNAGLDEGEVLRAHAERIVKSYNPGSMCSGKYPWNVTPGKFKYEVGNK